MVVAPVLVQNRRWLWLFAVVNDKFLVQKTFPILVAAGPGVEEGNRELVLGLAGAVAGTGGVHRVGSLGAAAQLLVPGKHLLGLVAAAGDFVEIALIEEGQPRLQIPIVVPVPVQLRRESTAAAAAAAVSGTHRMILLAADATGSIR